MQATGNPKETARLNDLLGRELGRNLFGPIFAWGWSEDLLWPATATGRTITKKKTLEVPIVGGGMEQAEMEESIPEYRAERQTRQIDTWFMTKWLSAEDLIHGGTQGHGRGYRPDEHPSDATLRELWNRQFPGADFPVKGWRVATDASLPRGPHDPKIPNMEDTLHFIRCIKEQTSMSLVAREADMLAYLDRRDAQELKPIEDEIRDSFPAMLNPKPGAKGAFVSFPTVGHNRDRSLNGTQD